MAVDPHAHVAPLIAPARAPKRTQRAKPAIHPPVAAPILKWVGGKTRLLGEIRARMPQTYGRYFEPFMGGGALYFRTGPGRAVLGDWNKDLINVYRCVAWNVDAVAKKLANHKRRHCEEYYYRVRTRWNERSPKQTPEDRAAQFLYMNKTCFNGLYRVNRSGEFNVPMGRYRNPAIYDLKALRAASALLQRAELYQGHYGQVVETAKAGDFVYFDPPYHPLTETSSFTSYTKDDFGADDQKELEAVARDLVDRGCHVVLSNSDTPFIRELYSSWKVETVMCGRSINSKASSRGRVAEVLISGSPS